MNHTEQLLQTQQMARSTKSDCTNYWWERVVNAQGQLLFLYMAGGRGTVYLYNHFGKQFGIIFYS